MTTKDTKDFLVRRDRLSEHRILVSAAVELQPGAVELQVDRFGLTANNVTYGVLGDALSYWKFFPTSEVGWGRLPVWGFGTVTGSAVEGIAVGERFYGYFPMSSHVTFEPRRVDPVGFVDGAAHRRELSPIYNQYLRTTSDPSYRPDTEGPQVILRPLIATALFLADYLEANESLDVKSVLLSSASSKLAHATAFVLRQRPAPRRFRELVALTSRSNREFVIGLGLYDRVIAYDDIGTLASDETATFIDLAGSREVREAVHRRFGDALKHSSSVGATHWESLGRTESLPGPSPETFFAPAWIKRRSDAWGAAEVQRRLAATWAGFLERMTDPRRALMTIVTSEGVAAVAKAYDEVLAGRARPRDGHVLSLLDPATSR